MSQAVLSQAAISVSLIESSVVRCTDVFVCRNVLSVGLHKDDLRRHKCVTQDNERSCLILQGNERNIPDGLAPDTIGRPKIGECRSCSAGNLRGASCFAPRSRIFAPGADFSSGARLKCSLMLPHMSQFAQRPAREIQSRPRPCTNPYIIGVCLEISS